MPRAQRDPPLSVSTGSLLCVSGIWFGDNTGGGVAEEPTVSVDVCRPAGSLCTPSDNPLQFYKAPVLLCIDVVSLCCAVRTAAGFPKNKFEVRLRCREQIVYCAFIAFDGYTHATPDLDFWTVASPNFASARAFTRGSKLGRRPPNFLPPPISVPQGSVSCVLRLVSRCVVVE